MTERPLNWLFLGDSLTEGIGSSRATYVTALARLLRASHAGHAVHDLRLRFVDPATFNPYIAVNIGGHVDLDDRTGLRPLWLWNLGAEGQTIENDLRWMPLADNLRPERIFIHRGSLESIIRPAALKTGNWPVWVPPSWRGFVAMDPRCYYSDTLLRRAKQAGLDWMKQRVRLSLLHEQPGTPLMDVDAILAHYRALLSALSRVGSAITLLGLLAPDARTFPGSAAHFASLNGGLARLAAEFGATFLDWNVQFNGVAEHFYYRDGFHPNQSGANRLAEILHAHLEEVAAL